MTSQIQIAGAGISGLSAAIKLAQAGYHVIVHEASNEVGHRFQGDYQGLENWSTPEDVLSVLKRLGITADFPIRPYQKGTAFDAWGTAYEINSKNDLPLFYLIERGSGQHSLDSALLRQAISLGVEIRFNSLLKRLKGPGILATGPKVADAIAVGYHFKTNMDDGFWVIFDDDLAPKGYAYLLIKDNRGTVKSCMFSNFKSEKKYVENTVKRFEHLVGLKMLDPKFHGGVGNFRIPENAYHGTHPIVGEQVGCQDMLFGFGIRLAIQSGILAAESIIKNKNYNYLCQEYIRPQMQASLVNRALYNILGNRGYRFVLRRWSQSNNLRLKLNVLYKKSFLKWCLLPWAMKRIKSQRTDESCNHIDCSCVWCRQNSK